jgi:hypothetical protein
MKKKTDNKFYKETKREKKSPKIGLQRNVPKIG